MNHPLQALSKEQTFQPAIMQSISLQNVCTCHKKIYYSHVNSDCLTMQNNTTANNYCVKCCNNNIKSFLLIDEYENLTVTDVEQFLDKLNFTNANVKVKVISIIGNTGDEKNHVINQIFFKDLEIFTANDQNSCTLGVWAAFDPINNVICLNTKGITMYDENKCTKLLLKVLAVSDVVIYRTYSVNLNSNLFKFLSSASSAYNYYFQAALKTIAQRERVSNSLNSFGPSILVLHETKCSTASHLTNDKSKVTEDVLRVKFARMKLNTEAFSSIKYVVLEGNHTIDYELVRSTIRTELNDITVRSARKPNLVYNILETLNDKFPDRESLPIILFPDQYFTCPAKCLSCECICTSTIGHLREGKPHINNNKCQYQHQYGNVKYICMKCYNKGNIVEVIDRFQAQNESSWYSLARYAWSGYIIECPNCGEIYRSRQYWYGNQNPEDTAVCTEIKHVWNTQNTSILSQNTAQRVVDGVSYITEAVTNVSLQPTKALSSWVADQVAPSYWRSNHEIKECHNCEISFSPTDTKHHCRDCGEGFCELCTSQTKCVPSRNWYTPVRVCATCYTKDSNSNDNRVESIDDISIRKMTEQVVSTFNIVGTVLNYSKSLIKDSVRPSYWIPDSEITNCCVCYQKFSDMSPLHHCRDCGHGVCQECSQNYKPVVYRGWDKPVRVCDTCFNTD